MGILMFSKYLHWITNNFFLSSLFLSRILSHRSNSVHTLRVLLTEEIFFFLFLIEFNFSHSARNLFLTDSKSRSMHVAKNKYCLLRHYAGSSKLAESCHH